MPEAADGPAATGPPEKGTNKRKKEKEAGSSAGKGDPAGAEATKPPKKTPRTAAEAAKDDIQTQLNIYIQKAHKLKVQLSAASSSAEDLLNVIARDPKWTWAFNEHTLLPLRQAREGLSTFKESSKFYQDWVVAENFGLVVRKQYEEKVAFQEFERLGEAEKRVAKLAKEVACLKRMHKARQDD